MIHIHARLVLYKRIANTETFDELQVLKIEMIDRFGLFSDAVKALFFVSEIKQQANHLGLKKIEFSQAGGRIVFGESPKINTEQLIILVQTQAQCYQLKGTEQLNIIKNFADLEERVGFIKQLLQQLCVV